MRAHDQGFVAAPPTTVHASLANPSAYGAWWSGDRSNVLPDGDAIRVESARPDVGLVLRVPRGSLEWYLEPFDDGTIVNAFLDVDLAGSDRRRARRLRRMRSSIHSGLVGLKRALEPR